MVGLGALLISDVLVGRELKNGADHPAASIVALSDGLNGRASLITVKAYYTMMAQYIDISEEVFVLQSPAILQDLLNTCIVRHPPMAQMRGTMLILLDGSPSRPGATLRDGDRVQFIPLIAGG